MGAMVDANVRGESREDRTEGFHGISFETWAFVLSGLGDGFALFELLTYLELDEGRWSAADEAFQEELLSDVERGGGLSEALDDAMREAKKSWSRPIPPLDCDLQAWFDFYRAWTANEASMAFLHAMGLRASDIHRLQALWRDRLAGDASLRAEAMAILAAPARLAPMPNPEPPRLIGRSAPEVENADVTAPLALHPVGQSLPFVAGAAAPMRPPLSVPLPPPRVVARCGGPDEASSSPITGNEAVLPFPVAASRKPASVIQTGDSLPGTFTVELYAALCVEFMEAPSLGEATLTAYGITPAQKVKLDAYWTQRMAEEPAVWLAWDRACSAHRVAIGGRGSAAWPIGGVSTGRTTSSTMPGKEHSFG